jgi:hypothetical protein
MKTPAADGKVDPGDTSSLRIAIDPSLVIAGADELDGCQMDGSDWNRNRIKRAPQCGRRHFDGAYSAD